MLGGDLGAKGFTNKCDPLSETGTNADLPAVEVDVGKTPDWPQLCTQDEGPDVFDGRVGCGRASPVVEDSVCAPCVTVELPGLEFCCEFPGVFTEEMSE